MRFYFDFENGYETVRDDEGVEADDLDQALDDAQSAIQEIAQELKDGALGDEPVLIVRDETGSSVARLPVQALLDHFLSSDRDNVVKLYGKRRQCGC
jgi:hypothetical protein